MTEAPRIGSCSFTAAGWETAFYPAGLRPADYLGWYAREFDTLEIDSTFYRAPSVQTVQRWYRATPDGFTFALKMPKAITHDRCLVDCDEELARFFSAASQLQEKLGVVLLQFPYFNRQSFPDRKPFLARLKPTLESLPSDFRFAVELRNKGWIDQELAELLQRHRVAIALIDHPWMWRPAETLERLGNPELDLAYIRLLGDRHKIEEVTMRWDRTVIDRSTELQEWINICQRLQRRGTASLVYVNNHYAGHAPATMRQFREMWGATVVSSQ